MFLLLATTLFIFLRLLIHFFNRLANLPLLLTRLHSYSDIARTATRLDRLVDCTLRFFPVCVTGTDFVSVGSYISFSL